MSFKIKEVRKFLFISFVFLLVFILNTNSIFSYDCQMEGDCCKDREFFCVGDGCAYTTHCPGNHDCTAYHCAGPFLRTYCESYIIPVAERNCANCASCAVDSCCLSGCVNDDDCVGTLCTHNVCDPSRGKDAYTVCNNGYWGVTKYCDPGLICKDYTDKANCEKPPQLETTTTPGYNCNSVTWACTEVTNDASYPYTNPTAYSDCTKDCKKSSDSDTPCTSSKSGAYCAWNSCPTGYTRTAGLCRSNPSSSYQCCIPGSTTPPTTIKPGCTDACHDSAGENYACGGGFCYCCQATGACNTRNGCTLSACPSECGSNPPSLDVPSCVGNEGSSCGACGTGSVGCGGSCDGDRGCIGSCPTTEELRCTNGKLEHRTRSAECCYCPDFGPWHLKDDCTTHDAWCRSNSCVDCDNDESICSSCGSSDFYASIYSGSENQRCCRNLKVTGPGGANEYPFYDDIDQVNVAKPGGWACCDERTDCAIADRTCVNNYYFNSDNISTIVDQEFICFNGNISTRTELIAIKLMELANKKDENNYILHCDKPELALNTITWKGQTIKNINNVCVLQVKDRVYVGTSLNQNSNFLSIINTSDVCDNIQNTNDQYQVCKYNNFYYNPKTKSVIFSNKEITDLIPNSNVFVSLFNFFKNMFTGNVIKITGRPVQENEQHGKYFSVIMSNYPGSNVNPIDIRSNFITQNHPYVSALNDRYNVFYLSVVDGKKILATRQPRKDTASGAAVEIILLDFYDESNLCNANYQTSRIPKAANCTFTPNPANTKIGISSLFMQNTSFSDKAWIDMTASLRPK